MSFDRGLSRTQNGCAGGPALPGHLGRAAPRLRGGAGLDPGSPALAGRRDESARGTIRAEVARRRAARRRAQRCRRRPRGLGRALIDRGARAPRTPGELIAGVAALLLTLALFARWSSLARRARTRRGDRARRSRRPCLAGGACSGNHLGARGTSGCPCAKGSSSASLPASPTSITSPLPGATPLPGGGARHDRGGGRTDGRASAAARTARVGSLPRPCPLARRPERGDRALRLNRGSWPQCPSAKTCTWPRTSQCAGIQCARTCGRRS